MLLGQYSVGKTSFIRYLLGRDFPKQHIGPEPTTDGFLAVMYGDQDKTTPGNALTSQPDTPFHSLRRFGNALLDKVEAVYVPAPILRRITLVDTPGVQAGERQKGRGYDLLAVVKWWAQHADRIVLVFDPFKMSDISAEFRDVIEQLRDYKSKARALPLRMLVLSGYICIATLRKHTHLTTHIHLAILACPQPLSPPRPSIQKQSIRIALAPPAPSTLPHTIRHVAHRHPAPHPLTDPHTLRSSHPCTRSDHITHTNHTPQLYLMPRCPECRASQVRVVLNKADNVESQKLMRVYGALMWALGSIMCSPEVPRVYIGSFIDEPWVFGGLSTLMDAEEMDLVRELDSLPEDNVMRKINEIARRASNVKVHVHLLAYMRECVTSKWMGRKQAQEWICSPEGMRHCYEAVERSHGLSAGDFPSAKRLAERLQAPLPAILLWI
ncbi:MAG: hypothetical protein SGPRY_006530 [Prymnesium sp.]